MGERDELNEFMEFISPTLQNKVKSFIFTHVLKTNRMFNYSATIVSNVIQYMELEMINPEIKIV
jgi:hypothetical protein